MPKRILVIDDEELLTRTFSRLLQKNGYDVFVAKNGQDALEMCKAEDFDLIVCDIRMPGLDGVNTIKAIQQNLVTSSKVLIPVIFVTGYADETVEAEASTLKPVTYLYKPFDNEKLMTIIRKCLE